jgi:DNA-3-methyladenine glycosylase II
VNYTKALTHLKACDPILARLITELGDCTLGERSPNDSLFEALTRSIVYQRISIQSANAVYGRFLANYGDRHPTPNDLLGTDDDHLRQLGLPYTKIAYLKDLAATIQQGLPDLPELATWEDSAIIKTLTQIKGIGRWSVEMVLIFQLHRLDVLPIDDFGIRAAIQTCYRLNDLPKKADMERIAEPWKPYRSIASWYLWRSRDAKNRELLDTW